MSDDREKPSDNQDEDKRQPLEEGSAVPTSRIGRFLKTGWAARRALPLAFKRTSSWISSDEGDREKALEKLLKEQEAIAEELFRTFGNMKGVVQKFGQLASYLEGVLPPEVAPAYQKVLSRLQDAAPALPPLAARSVIEDQLDCFLEDHFAHFDEQPHAAASVGQVHKATLLDGTEVAVKVQYPGIEKAFQSDLGNLKMLELLFSPLVHYYKGKETLELLRQQLLDELDYEREARAQQRFGEMFEGHPRISIPKVFPALSTKKVLVSEWVEGLSFDQICRASEEVRLEAAISLATYFIESIHFHHFTNVDPHPGNYIFHPDGRVTCLDFGAAVPIDPDLVTELRKLLEAVRTHDMEAFQEQMFTTLGADRDMDPVMLEAQTHLMFSYLTPLDPQKQPFTFSPEWVNRCAEESMEAAREILLRGGRVPKLPPPPTHVHPDLTVAYRVVLGLGSLLAKLQPTYNWPELYVSLLEKET